MSDIQPQPRPTAGQPAPATQQNPDEPVRYETGRGCLILSLALLVLLGLMIAAIVVFGDSPVG